MIQVETPTAESGGRTLVANGRFMHSRYDPRKEAERMAAPAAACRLAVVLSPGLGYLADHLPAARVIMIERHPEIAALSPGRRIMVCPSPGEVVAAILAVDGWEEGRLAILTGTVLPEDVEYYRTIRAAVEEAIDRKAEQAATIKAFAGTWERNLIDNAGLIRAAGKGRSVSWISDLDGVLGGRTVLLFAAGPSLREDLAVASELMRNLPPSPTRPLILAVDSALPSVLAAGIAPDYCCTIDPQEKKASSLTGLGDVPLIASVLAPRAALSQARRLFLFGQGHPSEPRYGIPASAVEMEIGGSVATAAATLSIRFGASGIILSGQDLALVDRRLHVRGTVHERASSLRAGRFISREGDILQVMERGKMRMVEGVRGGTVPTTPAMDSYRKFFLNLSKLHPNVKFIQTSPSGASIGVEKAALSEVLETYRCPADRLS